MVDSKNVEIKKYNLAQSTLFMIWDSVRSYICHYTRAKTEE